MFLKNSKFFRKFKISENFLEKLLWGIWRSEVVTCGDRAAAYIVGAVSIRAPAGDLWEKREPFGRRKWPYWCTTAAAKRNLYGRTGTHRYKTVPFFDLQFPRRAVPQRRPACTPTVTYVAHFLQANFELHTYDVGENDRQAGETTGNFYDTGLTSCFFPPTELRRQVIILRHTCILKRKFPRYFLHQS
jgi:hypothetical protein